MNDALIHKAALSAKHWLFCWRPPSLSLLRCRRRRSKPRKAPKR